MPDAKPLDAVPEERPDVVEAVELVVIAPEDDVGELSAEELVDAGAEELVGAGVEDEATEELEDPDPESIAVVQASEAVFVARAALNAASRQLFAPEAAACIPLGASAIKASAKSSVSV